MIRAFLALPVTGDVRARLSVLQFLLPLPRRVEPVDFHLTLTFLDSQPHHVLAALDEAMQALRQTRFSLEITGAGLFGGARPHAAWAGVAASEALGRLQAKCDRAARAAGVTLEARRFRPHITLGRFPAPAAEDALRLERAVAAESAFRAGVLEVDEVILYRSHPGGTPPRYEAMASYRLG